MRVVDTHVHMNGEAKADAVLERMDANGVDRTIVLSQSERRSLQTTREHLLATKKLCDAAPDRLTGLARLEPTIPGMKDLAREALEEMGFAGIKIIPDHWYAYEERLEPWWEAMNEMEARILFHTGILYGFEDDSRFCRPLWLEKLLFYPNIRFAMAHVSWPWCDECLAVMGRMRAGVNGDRERWQSYVDLTPGIPMYMRKQAIANAVGYCGVDRILFGSDATIPGDLKYQKEILDRERGIFDELGLDAAQQERIFSGTADELVPAVG